MQSKDNNKATNRPKSYLESSNQTTHICINTNCQLSLVIDGRVLRNMRLWSVIFLIANLSIVPLKDSTSIFTTVYTYDFLPLSSFMIQYNKSLVVFSQLSVVSIHLNMVGKCISRILNLGILDSHTYIQCIIVVDHHLTELAHFSYSQECSAICSSTRALVQPRMKRCTLLVIRKNW